jgi:5-methylcytosine-specific restriction endonuclease McrA
MEFMLRNLLETFPMLSRKDNQRDFTYVQKLAVFRRDKGICQLRIKCNGEKLTWDDWQCDHITPWSKGGKTTVKNGQVSCASCNLSKGNINPKFS